MKSLIRYIPDNVIIDLAAPGLGHPDAWAIIKRHHLDGSRATSPFNRANPAFECLRHQDGSNPGVFMRMRGGEWWAVHYEASRCGPIRIPAPMSDEHKRQAEYWARAAEDAGYHAELEYTLETGTRPDVLIDGPVRTGVEVQRSPMTASSAVKRTRKAALAAVTDIWFSNATLAPKWAWRVPTVLSRELGIRGEGQSWDATPPRRSVAAAGLRQIRAARCTGINFNDCPDNKKRGGFCGRYHPKPEVWRGLSVDDVAARFPAGQIVPLRFWGVRLQGSRHREAVFLVPPQSAALYTELTGRAGAAVFVPETEDRPPRRPRSRHPCHNQQPQSVSPADQLPPGLASRQPAVARCGICQLPLSPVLAQAGETTHPTCDPGGLGAWWPARRTGLCVVCLHAIEVGHFIRQVPGHVQPGPGPVFAHDYCIAPIARAKN